MMQFQNIIDEFNEAIAELANVWRDQQVGFTDKKIQKFGTEILRPISDAGAKINGQAERLTAAIRRLRDCNL